MPKSKSRKRPRQIRQGGRLQRAKEKKLAEDQKTNRNLAIGLGLATLVVWITLYIFKQRDLATQGYSRVPIVFYILKWSLAAFSAGAIFSWVKNRKF